MTRRNWSTLSAVTALALIAVGCSEDSSGVSVSGVDSTPATTVAATATTPPTATTVPATGASTPVTTAATTAAPTTAAPLGDPVVALTEIKGFDQPDEVVFRPTDGLTYVVEQDGLIVMLTDGQPGATALDMTDLTSAAGERGLLGLAVNKDGTLAYVNYTNNDGDTRIDEYSVNADGTFDKSTRREVLGIAQPYPNHNGGDIDFGPDGMLYIGTGDGGSGGDPGRRALNMGELLGKILRIDPQPSGNAGYTVPPDNPFVGVDGARPEIWAFGLRNPWRLSFDRSTGDLWIADVGQNQWEEVDVGWAADGGGKGLNFGWSAMEGNHRFNEDQSADGVTPPIHEYEHVGNDCSISGSALYRGTKIPALVGYYVFADFCSGQIRALQIADRTEVKQVGLGVVPGVTSVSEGFDGELFIASQAGSIYTVGQG